MGRSLRNVARASWVEHILVEGTVIAVQWRGGKTRASPFSADTCWPQMAYGSSLSVPVTRASALASAAAGPGGEHEGQLPHGPGLHLKLGPQVAPGAPQQPAGPAHAPRVAARAAVEHRKQQRRGRRPHTSPEDGVLPQGSG